MLAAKHESKPEYTGIHISTRERVFKLLEKNHGLKPKQLLKLLDLDDSKRGTVTTYRKNWKKEYKNRQALKCLKFHSVRCWIYALKKMDRSYAVSKGWIQTDAKNRMLLWKSKLGRLEWFETGRINIWIKKPAHEGKLKQLLANSIFRTGVIENFETFNLWCDSWRKKRAHLTYDTGQKLPYAKIELLKESLGVVAKLGDISHPTCLELEFAYPDFNEKNELLFQSVQAALRQFTDLFGNQGQNGSGRPRDDFMIS